MVKDLLEARLSDATALVDTSETPAANDIARFTDVDTVEGHSEVEVRSDLNVADGAKANTIDSDPTGIAGADQTANAMSLTLAEYAAIGTKNASTTYTATNANGNKWTRADIDLDNSIGGDEGDKKLEARPIGDWQSA